MGVSGGHGTGHGNKIRTAVNGTFQTEGKRFIGIDLRRC